LLIAGWQVFKQLLLEGKHGVAAASAADTDAPASSDANSNSSSSKGADTSSDSSAKSIKALQQQVRKLQLQVCCRLLCQQPLKVAVLLRFNIC
jgi:hypothetical protein